MICIDCWLFLRQQISTKRCKALSQSSAELRYELTTIMTDLIANDPIPRRSLMLISVASLFGTVLGLVFSTVGPGLTRYEEVSLPILCVASLAAFVLLWVTGQRYFALIGRIMISLWGVHLVSNIANQIAIDPSNVMGTLVFFAWLPGYYVLAFVVLGKRSAEKICWTIFAVVTLMYFRIYSSLPIAAFSSDYSVAVSIILLITQASTISLLSAALGYRVRLEAAVIAQKEIVVGRELLSNTINSINPGVVVFDNTGKLLLANSSLSRATEGLGIPMTEGISWSGLAQHVANSGAKNSHNQHSSESWLESITRLHNDGGGSNQFDLPDGRSFLVFERQWQDGTSVITLTDVSELERSRETISQLQKMEALGRLTGGIAHDFNNMLSIILGNLEFIQLSLGDDTELNELLSQATIQTQNGATLVQQLLAFARGNQLKLSQVNPIALVEEMLPIAQSALGEQIRINFLKAGATQQINVESDLLQSMVINIALNARDAMSQGGLFTIEIEPITLNESGSPEGLVGDYISISFADTGTGISAQNLQHVFEPFYTTKPMEHGSGLGLSMVYGLAKQFNGDVRIKSALGVGTTVTLLFPATLDGSNQGVESIGLPEQQRYSGNALVVEDNEPLRRVSKLRLSRLGFDVVEAASIADAKMEFESGKFKLVFSDVILPDGNGYDLAQEIASIDSNVCVLLTSGYTELNGKDNMELEVDTPFIQKPHSNAELIEAISSLIG